MFGKGGMAGLLQQAQRMQENFKKAQEEIARMEIEGEAGAGLVKVVLTGKHECRRVSIDPSVLDDREMLEDLLTAAINDAARKLEAITSEKLGALAGGLGLPPGLKLPL
ncbi:MAG: YbaB/EbfC family nucleoid-associated protein [Casimicrobiaceae bacterium]|nr:YbaB/EbfC family nucleoid-associated protein [Casimicrobiaceae bacterium]MCX8097725.1 YbaB/EbfC family nucleoid-associated protein [Casimicrobiaceae bacterium]MDW8312298.1 YbaB/EbfC family nucleoid-associated protein [Burkholderiales bacterium]